MRKMPIRLSNCHRLKRIDATRMITVPNSVIEEYVKPSRATGASLKLTRSDLAPVEVIFTLAFDVDVVSFVNGQASDQPWDTETDQYVKYVRTDRIRHRHVTLPCYESKTLLKHFFHLSPFKFKLTILCNQQA